MTNSKYEESDGVRKVRLKTSSGVLTLCYRSSQSSREADSSPKVSSVEKASQEGSQVSGVSKDSGFESLPELFEFSDQFSLCESSDVYRNSVLDLRPDFSTYKFWADSGNNLPHAVDLSDTFSRSDLPGMLDHAAPGLEPIAEDARCLDALENCGTKPDLHFQNTAVKSSTIGEINTNRKSYWDFPLELEEDIFECANYCNLLKEGTDERENQAESVVDDFLVDRTPEFCEGEANDENLDSNLLVYAPNRYLEDACIFQSSPADLESDIETLGANGAHRIHESQTGSRRKTGTILEDSMRDGQSLGIKSRNSDTTVSCIEEPDVQDVTAKHPMRLDNGDKARVLRIYEFVNHRRRRFSALRAKRSKLPKRTNLTSLDKRSPKQARSEITPGRRVIASPSGKLETARRLFKAASSSDSQSAGDSDHNCHNRPLGTTPRQLSVPSDHNLKAHVGHRAEISPRKSASNPLKDAVDKGLRRRAPGLQFSPLKDILNKSLNRDVLTSKLSSNPCLPRKQRTRYADVFHSPDDSNGIGTGINRESLSQDSPKRSNSSKANTPRDSPAIGQFQSPKVGRKKVRTSRRRPPQGSPTSAKKLRFYGKIISESSSQVLHGTPAFPGRGGQFETKSAERKGRRRPPLPASSVEILQGWLHDNLPDPYPSREEKEDLMFQTSLKMSQIDNWLGNARQKLKLKSRPVKDLCSESSLSPERPKKRRLKMNLSYPLKRL
ncbi:unnamed protein product [Calypogeia fissa]